MLFIALLNIDITYYNQQSVYFNCVINSLKQLFRLIGLLPFKYGYNNFFHIGVIT